MTVKPGSFVTHAVLQAVAPLVANDPEAILEFLDSLPEETRQNVWFALRRQIGGTKGITVAITLDERIRPVIQPTPLPYSPKNLTDSTTDKLTARAGEAYKKILARGGVHNVFLARDWWVTLRRPPTSVNRVSKVEALNYPLVGTYTANGLFEQDFINDVLYAADTNIRK